MTKFSDDLTARLEKVEELKKAGIFVQPHWLETPGFLDFLDDYQRRGLNKPENKETEGCQETQVTSQKTT